MRSSDSPDGVEQLFARSACPRSVENRLKTRLAARLDVWKLVSVANAGDAISTQDCLIPRRHRVGEDPLETHGRVCRAIPVEPEPLRRRLWNLQPDSEVKLMPIREGVRAGGRGRRTS